MTSFIELKNAYPMMSRKDLYNQLGGEWPTLVDNPKYQNTCSIRLSTALSKLSYEISDSYREAITGDGKNLIIKVKTMDKYIRSLLGEYTWAMSKKPGDSFSLGTIPSKYKGIIGYHVDWKDSSGHFDLWDGFNFVGPGSEDRVNQIKDGFDIVLWEWK